MASSCTEISPHNSNEDNDVLIRINFRLCVQREAIQSTVPIKLPSELLRVARNDGISDDYDLNKYTIGFINHEGYSQIRHYIQDLRYTLIILARIMFYNSV